MEVWKYGSIGKFRLLNPTVVIKLVSGEMMRRFDAR
jgi:hypothetical protein